MLHKVYLTSHARMSGCRWVVTSLWLSESWRSLLYSSLVYSCHLFAVSFAYVQFIPFLSFIVTIFEWNVPLVSQIFFEEISSLSYSLLFLYFFFLLALITELRWWRICLQYRRPLQSLGWEGNLEKEMATLSSTLALGIPWTEERGGLQSIGSQTDWATNTFTLIKRLFSSTSLSSIRMT